MDEVILVVGANPRNLELLADVLGRQGYCVVPGDSVEACDRDLCVRCGGRPVALALIDIAGLDLQGWEGCKCLCGRRVPVLVLSRRMDSHVREAWLANGARAVLAKPLAPRDLLGTIRGLLGN